MITLYGIPNCDTIKKTKKWLDEQQLQYELHDYKKLGCSTELLNSFVDQFTLEQVLNKRGTTWRKLSDAQKDNITTESAIQLMKEQPSMIKRPIIHSKDCWLIGYDEEAFISQLID